ncbi:MAG: hypothetical protein JWN48_1811 [Myxococcaceae bacterium]|nr:hypothetical protein [Myxococcaceae bacterium]
MPREHSEWVPCRSLRCPLAAHSVRSKRSATATQRARTASSTRPRYNARMKRVRSARPAESRALDPIEEQSAGPFSSWLHETRRAQKLKVLGADVPCGSCIGCCRGSLFIHIRPEESATLARIPKPLLFPAPGAPAGHVLMGFNEKGECPMLRDDKCTIYEQRPQTCRDFDCRIFAATGITLADDGPQAEIARRARSWRFDYASELERQEASAVQAAAAFLRDHVDEFPSGSLPSTPVQLAVLAVQIYELFRELGAAPGQGEPASASAVARDVLRTMETLGMGPRKPKTTRRR